MECRYVRDLADALVAGHLPLRMVREVIQHLDACQACQDEFHAQQSLRASLRCAFDRADFLRLTPEFASRLSMQLHAWASGQPQPETPQGPLPLAHTPPKR
jgi:predicted anti-sigma-YlaC factor YlaD